MSDRTINEPSPWTRQPNAGRLAEVLAWLERALVAANRHIANGVPRDRFSWTIFM